MATYYWVGGAGTWDGTTTTNWSLSSGGAGSAGVPTSADNVIFNSLSNATAYAVTIGVTANAATCLDVTMAGPVTGNVTFTLANGTTINVYGSWSNAATGVAFSSSNGSNIYFLSTTTGKTVNTNNINLGAVNTNFNGVGGGWTLSTAIQVGQSLSITNGSFNSGNQTITTQFFTSNNNNVRSITLGSSTLNLSGNPGLTIGGTNLTFDAGTSTITMTAGGTTTFAGGGNTYYNVNYVRTSANVIFAITGANTFNNLSMTSLIVAGYKTVTIDSNQTINGTLTLGAANGPNIRMYVQSNVLGTPRTLTVATLATLSDVDFRDIVAAGASAASPWTGTRIGNQLGNSNITFTAAKTVYWNLAGAQVWEATGWAPGTGGTPAAANFPLPQDTAVFDNAGSVTGTITLSTAWALGTVDMSNRTTAMTLSVTAAPSIYGNWKNGTGTTLSGTVALQFYNRTTQTITSNNVSFTQAITLLAFGGTVQLVDNLTTGSTITTTLTNGTLNLNDQTLSTGLFSSTNSNTRAIAFGTGKITTTGSGTVWNTSSTTGFSYTGTSRVDIANNSATATTISTGSVTEAQSLNFNFTTGSYTLTETTSVYKSLNFTGFSGTIPNSSRTIYGSLTLASGMTLTAGANATTFAATSGTNTITTATKTLDFPITFSGLGGTFAFQDALTQGSTRAFTITNGTVQLKASATSTVGAFATSGTTQKYLQSTTPGTTATLSQASGTVNASYLTVQDITATGGATWNAFYSNGSVDAGNNLGWNFGGTPAVDTEIGYRLRSFTQPRRF